MRTPATAFLNNSKLVDMLFGELSNTWPALIIFFEVKSDFLWWSQGDRSYILDQLLVVNHISASVKEGVSSVSLQEHSAPCVKTTTATTTTGSTVTGGPDLPFT